MYISAYCTVWYTTAHSHMHRIALVQRRVSNGVDAMVCYAMVCYAPTVQLCPALHLLTADNTLS